MPEEDEIDLRPHIVVVLRHWKLVLGMAAVAGVATGLIGLATPVDFQASATVAVSKLGTKPTPQINAYLSLALSQQLVAQVAQKLADHPGASAPSAAELANKLKAVAGPDPSLVALEVQDTNPREAAEIADTWSTVFVDSANATFNSAKESKDQLEAQLATARQGMQAAQDALDAVQARDDVELLQTQLRSQQSILAQLYTAKATLQVASEDATSLRDRLRSLDPTVPASAADSLAATLLQMNALSDESGGGPQIQLQEGYGSSNQTVGTLLAFVERLVASIDSKSQQTEGRIMGAEATLREISQKVQRTQGEVDSARIQRDNAAQTVKDLDLKATQATAEAAQGAGQSRVIAAAVVPTKSLSRGTAGMVAVAVVLGFIVGIGAAFGVDHIAVRRVTQCKAGLSQEA